MPNPIIAWIATLQAGTAVAQSGSITVTFHMTQGFEAHIPFVVTIPNTTGLSAGAQAILYESTDGGVTFETQGTVIAAFPTTPINTVAIKVGKLTTGQYVLRLMVGGGTATTFSAQVLTGMVITAYS